MPRRRKPVGWPRYMEAKRVRTGDAYFWNPPSWARKEGCPVKAEALGNNFATAKTRCDDVLNPQFDSWRLHRSGALPPLGPVVGSFDWMVSVYKGHPAYTKLKKKPQADYAKMLDLVSSYVLKNGQRFGTVQLASITPGAADKLFEALKVTERDGAKVERMRTATYAMTVCRRAWSISYRLQSKIVPAANPFQKMETGYKPKSTKAVSHDVLIRLTAAADAAGAPSIGTAAMIAFYWLQRQVDILTRLSWSHYRPADNPRIARVWHHKTGEVVEVPLYDEDGTELWPDLMARLDAAPRRGTLIVTRDRPDRSRKVHLPWGVDHFRHSVGKIRKAAGIEADLKFMGLRHGGNVEGAEADLTDAQLRALSGHKTTATLLRYAQVTEKQRQAGARKRLELRTKRGDLSE